jgi:hypothetical protein
MDAGITISGATEYFADSGVELHIIHLVRLAV